MESIHCGACGGVIGDPSKISYRLPSRMVEVAEAREGSCSCEIPVVYGPPSGFRSIPSMPSAKRGPGAKFTRGPKRSL